MQVERIIDRWHTLKAQTTGQECDSTGLSEVLGGKMLETWKHRVEKAKMLSYYWKYETEAVTIKRINLSEDYQKALAEISVEETATYVGNLTSMYRYAYSAQYQLQLNGLQFDHAFFHSHHEKEARG